MATIETKKNIFKKDLALPYLARPASRTSIKQKAIMLLHGVGSQEQDLFQLATHLPGDMTVISPRGPFKLGEGRYAWYQVDFSSGRPEINAAQEAQSRQIIQLFTRQVKERYKLDEVYLGGFSQGAIMSYSIGLTHPGLVAGILAFSGRILREIRPLVHKDAALQQLKAFVSHGTQDSTLPVHYAREAKEYLLNAGVQLTYQEYEMGHQINHQVVSEMISWLQV